jgi:thymidylate synthase
MKNIEIEYKQLIKDILDTGRNKEDRTGTGTISLFGKTIEHDMRLGFPIITGKKVSFKAARTELLWILQGRTDLKYLEDNGVKYWRPDYERSGRTDETLGPVYGKQWRNFNGVDQLKNLVYSINTNPDSRRLIVSAWAPHELDDMALPPCHYAFQVYINNGVIDLMWQQRSADVFLGLPYDITMYGLLLEMLAKGAGLKAGQLIGQLGDCHLYNNHLEQAKLYLERPKRALPSITLEEGIRISKKMDAHGKLIIPEKSEIKLNNYNPYPTIKAELSVGN